MHNIRGILFDKDGTLLDFNAMWIPVADELVNEILKDLGPVSKQDIKAELFKSIGIYNNKVESNGVYAHGTASDIAEAFIKVLEAFKVNYTSAEIFKKHLIDKYNEIAKDDSREVVPTADLKAALENLKKRGILIGLSTADTPESTESCLKKLGIFHYFDFIGTDNGRLRKKPAPDLLNEFCRIYQLAPCDVAVVGDTRIDMEFAKNGGSGLAIGVLSGVCSREELSDMADVILPSVEYLINENAPVKQALEIVDSHVHIRGYNAGDVRGILDGIYEIKRRAGLKSLNVAAIPVWDLASAGQNALCILYKTLYPECYAYAGLDHYGAGIDRSPEGRLNQLKRFLEMGFDGIKSIEYKPTSRKAIKRGLNSPEYKMFFKFLEENAVPVLWHVADPEANWHEELCSEGVKACGWCYADGSFLSKKELQNEVEEVLGEFPKLNVVFAHLYFLSENVEEARSFMRRYPNINIDVTPGIEMYFDFSKSHDAWREFFIEYADRILFGTDNGWGDDISPQQKVENGLGGIGFLIEFFSTNHKIDTYTGTKVQGLALPDDVLRRMFSVNFLNMHKRRVPKKVNVNMAYQYVQELYDGLSAKIDIPFETCEQVKSVVEIFKTML